MQAIIVLSRVDQHYSYQIQYIMQIVITHYYFLLKKKKSDPRLVYPKNL